jgi:uncharacterized lipoprotein YajG
MNKITLLIAFIVLLAACTRSQTSIQRPPRAEGPSNDQLREIATALPEIQENVTIQGKTDIVPDTENPFPELI